MLLIMTFFFNHVPAFAIKPIIAQMLPVANSQAGRDSCGAAFIQANIGHWFLHVD